MSVSRKSKNMKKSSKRSKNLRNNKKTKKNLKKMKGGVRMRELVVNSVYNFTYPYVNALYPDGKVFHVPKTNNKYLRQVEQVHRDEHRLEFQNIDSNEIFQIDVDFMDDFILQQ